MVLPNILVPDSRRNWLETIQGGLNLISRSCFFTKNGKFLGVAVRNLPVIEYYPTIGVHSKDECVEVNLGQKPFLYNIAMEKILYNAHQKDMAKKTS